MAINDSSTQKSDQDRSVHVGGNATGSALVTGDQDTVSIQFQQASLPKAESVNIQAEINALKTILAGFNDPIATGVAQKLEQEVSKSEPDKSVVASTLETGLTYARNLSGFAEAMGKLRPHVEAVAGWLGEHGYKLLPLVGLVL